MITTIATMIIVLIIVAVAYWAVDALHTPEPLNRIVKVGVVAIAIIVVIVLFLQLLGITVPMGVNVPKV